MIDAMIREIQVKKELFGDFEFGSLYFGGGTPSLLKIEELKKLLESIFKYYHFNSGFEFTMEANPEDVTREYVYGLRESGVNRLSIGIQSFIDRDLVLMRRSHTSDQAINAIRIAKEKGFDNINADLIYGLPGLTNGEWEENLNRFFSLDIPHLSAYHLTYEPGTVFDHWRKKARIMPVTDDDSLMQFKILKSKIMDKGFMHYEISNFGREKFLSKHNLVYWNLQPYVGIGPSAHSYDGERRYWNRSNNKKYIELLAEKDGKLFEYEQLSLTDKFNEYILTSLRTIWGADLEEIRQRFGEYYVKYAEKILNSQIKFGLCEKKGTVFCLTEEGVFLSDAVMRDFFLV